MTETKVSGRKPRRWVQILLFVFFLLLLAAVLKGMGWCVGGVCDVGLDMFLQR